MTKNTSEFLQFCAVENRECTLPRDDESSQPKRWIQRNTKIGPVIEVTTSYLHGKHGVEIRSCLWAETTLTLGLELLKDQKTNLMDLNNNDTAIPEDQLEDQALQLDAKDFVSQAKAKATPPRREPTGSSLEMIPMEWRNWIDFEPGNYHLSEYVFHRKYIDKTMERFISAVSKKMFRIRSRSLFIGLTIDGKYAWQQGGKKKLQYCTDVSGINCLCPSSSKTFRTQSYWSFITRECDNSAWILPTIIPYMMCVHSSLSRASRSCKDWLLCTTSSAIRAQCMEEAPRCGILGRYWSCDSKRKSIYQTSHVSHSWKRAVE